MKVLMSNGEYRLVLKGGYIEVQQRTFDFWVDKWWWCYYASLTDYFDDFLEFKKDMNKKKGLFINFGCQTLELDEACELYVLLEDYFKYLLDS